MKQRSDWLVVAMLFAATMVVEGMSWNQLTAYTPLYLRELHVPPEQVPGWIAALSSVGWILALPLAPFWGVLADRYSRKLIIVRSAALEAVIFAGWAFATTPWMALGFICLNGFILGNTGVMLAVQASTTPPLRLALAVGIIGAGSPAGRTIGPILGAALVHLFDVRGMLLFDAAISAAMALLLALLVREGEYVRPTDLRVLSLLRGAVSEIAGRALLWRLFLAMTITQAGLWAVLPYVPLFITRLAPSNPVTAIGVVLSLAGLGAALASPAWGMIIQRFGHVAVLSAASAGACLALLAVGASRALLPFAAFLVLQSVFVSATVTATMAVMAATVTAERRGAVLGLIMFPFYVGGIIGPLIGNVAFHAGQSAVFGVAAVLSLAPLMVMLTMRQAVAQTRPA